MWPIQEISCNCVLTVYSKRPIKSIHTDSTITLMLASWTSWRLLWFQLDRIKTRSTSRIAGIDQQSVKCTAIVCGSWQVLRQCTQISQRETFSLKRFEHSTARFGWKKWSVFLVSFYKCEKWLQEWKVYIPSIHYKGNMHHLHCLSFRISIIIGRMIIIIWLLIIWLGQ